jgi:hypothetical protein
MGPSVRQNKQFSFIKSDHVYTVGNKNCEKRHLTQAMFKRQLRGCRSRMASIYSLPQRKMYSFVCNFFRIATDYAFNTNGFNNWKHELKATSHHENGQEMRHNIL